MIDYERFAEDYITGKTKSSAWGGYSRDDVSICLGYYMACTESGNCSTPVIQIITKQGYSSEFAYAIRMLWYRLSMNETVVSAPVRSFTGKRASYHPQDDNDGTQLPPFEIICYDRDEYHHPSGHHIATVSTEEEAVFLIKAYADAWKKQNDSWTKEEERLAQERAEKHKGVLIKASYMTAPKGNYDTSVTYSGYDPVIHEAIYRTGIPYLSFSVLRTTFENGRDDYDNEQYWNVHYAHKIPGAASVKYFNA